MGMIDQELVFMDDAAYTATPEVIDLGYTFNPGGGISMRGHVVGKDVAGTTALVIKTGATADAASTTIATIPMTHTKMNAGFNFVLPLADVQRFLTISFTGISAGTNITAYFGYDVQSA